MSDDQVFNVAAVVLPQSQEASHALEAKAPAMLAHYLKRAPDRTEAEDVIARDAYTQGYLTGHRAGFRDATTSWTDLCTVLNDRRFQLALAQLAAFLDSAPERERSHNWREVHRV